MGHMDFLERDVEINYEGEFQWDAVYKAITTWAKVHQYYVQENSYKASKSGPTQSLLVVLNAIKNFNEDRKIGMFITVVAPKTKTVKTKKKTMQEGPLVIKLTSYVLQDIEDTWVKNSFFQFCKEWFDTFMSGDRLSVCHNTIARDLRSLKSALKDHLRTPKPKK